ncbi:MAG TPA: hypothetical protein DCL77_03490 [Prolixibacteraceae bacterium]|jgi:uncharacterized membrane protein (DUF485 family)|nr:hypothetical protein [Prolixibacteraceae bacterium]
MEPHQTNPFKLAMTYGLYLGGITIFISVVIWATALMEKLGLWGNVSIGIINLCILIFLLIYFTKSYRDNQLDGKITFGKAFVFGVLIVLFSTVVSSLYNYIFAKFIDPGYAQRVMTMMQDKTYQWMSSRGLSEEQIDEAMVKFEKPEIPTPIQSLITSLKFGLIGGSIMSLVSSAIIKKNPYKDDAFDEAMEDVKTDETRQE